MTGTPRWGTLPGRNDPPTINRPPPPRALIPSRLYEQQPEGLAAFGLERMGGQDCSRPCTPQRV